MAKGNHGGSGAPPGNQYAVKPEGEGQSLTLYLSARDIAFLERLAMERGLEATDWRRMARQSAKNGIYRAIKAYMDAEIV